MLTSVSFGDRPSGTIAALALQKTAQMGKDRYPQAAEVVLNSTYVDDIIDSLDTNDEAIQISRDISELIRPGGFKIKEWFISNDKSMNTEISQTKADDCRDIETTNTIHFGSTRITKDQQEDGEKFWE
jgi:hypothetical protein